MKIVNKICMSILMLGAAAIAAPAMAQDEQNNANPTENAQPADSSSASSAGPAADASSSASAPANTQTAMNTTSSSSSEGANLTSVGGDTSKKYHRATRAKDFRTEKSITAQLNQQASAAAAPNTQTAMNQ